MAFADRNFHSGREPEGPGSASGNIAVVFGETAIRLVAR
jgi:hypothetical protein